MSNFDDDFEVIDPLKGGEMIGISEASFTGLLRDGKVKGFKPGAKSWRTRKKDVRDYVDTSIETGNAKSPMKQDTKDKIRLRAKLRSMDSLPKTIERIEEEEKKAKADLDEQTVKHRKIVSEIKVNTIAKVKEQKVETLKATPGIIDKLLDRTHPEIKDRLKEVAPAPVTQQQENGDGTAAAIPDVQEAETEAEPPLKKVPNPDPDFTGGG